MARPYPEQLYELLRCVCDDRGVLNRRQDQLVCGSCARAHAIVDGVPVVLHPEKSVFDADQVIRSYRERRPPAAHRGIRKLLRFVPSTTSSLVADKVFQSLEKSLEPIPRPRILVVGGGSPGAGLARLLQNPRYTFVESDIYFGSRSNLIADAHDLPFADNSFDAVISQAVLEHVLRPQACIDEMHRVLKPRGLLFVDVPFLFPVHMGAHDFTRFTLGGLRSACRWFEECEAGISGGPGQTVAMAIYYYSRSLSRSKLWSAFSMLVLPWFIFWLHHLDKLLVRRPQATDAASGVYFVGRKAKRPRTDREILQLYWENQTKPVASMGHAQAAAATASSPEAAHEGFSG